MISKESQISMILKKAGQTHHMVYELFNGVDADWASWYANWLVNLSKLSDYLERKPTQSELTYLLVSMDKEYKKLKPEISWQNFYAKNIIKYFG